MPQRKGYGMCGTVPPQLYVITAESQSITSMTDDGASRDIGSIDDMPCFGAHCVRGWQCRLWSGHAWCCGNTLEVSASLCKLVAASALPRHAIHAAAWTGTIMLQRRAEGQAGAETPAALSAKWVP